MSIECVLLCTFFSTSRRSTGLENYFLKPSVHKFDQEVVVHTDSCKEDFSIKRYLAVSDVFSTKFNYSFGENSANLCHQRDTMNQLVSD